MKIALITKTSIAGCVFGFALCVQAADDAGECSMSGCLEAGSEAGTYTLIDLGLTDGPRTVAITAVGIDLAGHGGHKVEVTGTTITGKGRAAHGMKGTAMKDLAATCP